LPELVTAGKLAIQGFSYLIRKICKEKIEFVKLDIFHSDPADQLHGVIRDYVGFMRSV